jgi:hypothetical protein
MPYRSITILSETVLLISSKLTQSIVISFPPLEYWVHRIPAPLLCQWTWKMCRRPSTNSSPDPPSLGALKSKDVEPRYCRNVRSMTARHGSTTCTL